MYKVVVLLFVTIFSLNDSIASSNKCYSILTEDEGIDSRTYSLNVDAINVRDFGKDYVAQSIAYVKELLYQVGCARHEVNFGQGALGRSKNRCVQIAKNRPYSRVCFIETNLGYFFVTRDFLTTVNLVYNRWD